MLPPQGQSFKEQRSHEAVISDISHCRHLPILEYFYAVETGIEGTFDLKSPPVNSQETGSTALLKKAARKF
jgi:hypothetical protein